MTYKGISDDTHGLVYLISTGRKGDLMHKGQKIRYASNQTSIYTEKQKGQSRLPALMLREGFMVVDDNDLTLLAFMDAHPLYGVKFERIDLEKDAEEELMVEELVTDIKAAIRTKGKQKDGTIALASLLAMRSKSLTVEKVSEMGPSEIRKALYTLVSNDPESFVDNKGVVNCFTDSSFIYQDVTIRALSEGIIKVNPTQTIIRWDNGETIINVPKSKDYVEFFANWLQTKEGKVCLKQIAEELGDK